MDFAISSKIVLNLAKASLALGRKDEAQEVIRRALIEASRIGARGILRDEGLI